jgi:hypothetical protein
VFGTAYLGMAPGRAGAVTAFTVVALALSGTALAAAFMGCLAIRRGAAAADDAPVDAREPSFAETH